MALNHICIMGRITRDIELRRTGSGIAVASFTVAVDRDRAPEGQEKETDFIDCVAWRQTGEFVDKYFSKGSMIVVSGRLQIRGWTDKDGNKRRSAEVVADNVYFGEPKRSDQPQNSAPNQQTPNMGYPQNGFQGGGQPSYPQYPQYPQGYNTPTYNQQGFGGYQQPGFSAPGYQPPIGGYAPIEGDDQQLPF